MSTRRAHFSVHIYPWLDFEYNCDLGGMAVKEERVEGGRRSQSNFRGMKIILECPSGGTLGKFLDSSNSQEDSSDRTSPFPRLLSYGMLRLKLARRGWKE